MYSERLRVCKTIQAGDGVPNSPSEVPWLQRVPPGSSSSSNSRGASKGSNVVNILRLKFLILPGLLIGQAGGSPDRSLNREARLSRRDGVWAEEDEKRPGTGRRKRLSSF